MDRRASWRVGDINLSSVSQICSYDKFTDGGGATGYIDFGAKIPEGALVLGWKATVHTGFTNEVSAIIQIGTAGSTDDLTAVTTKSVFTSNTIVGGVPKSGYEMITSEYTPRVTITGDADFTHINAGLMTVHIYFLQTSL